jgi:hypothetical protein
VNFSINLKITESEDFDFEAFREEVVAGLKAGRPFLGKGWHRNPSFKADPRNLIRWRSRSPFS